MFKKPQIVSLLFVVLIAGFALITTNCDFNVGELMERLEAESLWEESAHGDRTAEAFVHWDEDVPPVVSDRCAKCHSTSGYLDFLADGSVDTEPAVGETVECEACHTDPDNGILRDRASVTFPSGAVIDNLGPEGLCMECHQGRESTPDVDQEMVDSGAPDDDTIDSDIGFLNIHYAAAGATLHGTFTQGGYEYDGNDYDAKFGHVKGYNNCIACHNPHSLEVRIERCGTCHTGTDPKNFRMYGSFVDYDGDGDMTEGIYYEIPDFQDKLYEAILAYGNQTNNPIVYAGGYPYFVHDTDGDGVADESEIDRSNAYSAFTGRLLKACYNYQYSLKDHGAYAHGGKYLIQLLYDSLEDLNSALTVPVVDMDDFERDDEGHFDGSAEAFRHWDEDVPMEVEADCAKCHSSEGLAYYYENDAHIAQEITNGMLCTTCHTSPPSLRTPSSVTFPSGISKNMGDSSNLCITCHQGRHAKATVDAGIAAGTPGQYNFRDFNVHYFAVGAVLYGTEVQGGYEFPSKTYMGRNPFPNHNGRFDTCVECHMGTNTARETHEPSDHNVHKPNQADCVFCHGYDVSQPNPGNDPSKFKFSGIRPYSIPDFDADGNITESIQNEIQGLEAALYAQIQAYGFATGKPIVYADNYPYFFKDTNGNGVADPGETIFSNQYGNMNAFLLKAAYNYQLSKKEPHGFIHNPFYIAQLLVDSIESLGGSVAIYTWR